MFLVGKVTAIPAILVLRNRASMQRFDTYFLQLKVFVLDTGRGRHELQVVGIYGKEW